jgi:hypothetical protein
VVEGTGLEIQEKATCFDRIGRERPRFPGLSLFYFRTFRSTQAYPDVLRDQFVTNSQKSLAQILSPRPFLNANLGANRTAENSHSAFSNFLSNSKNAPSLFHSPAPAWYNRACDIAFHGKDHPHSPTL